MSITPIAILLSQVSHHLLHTRNNHFHPTPPSQPSPATSVPFASTILRRSNLTATEVIVALYYLRNYLLKERKDIKDASNMGRRTSLTDEEMIIGSLICANKILMDCVIPIIGWARITSHPPPHLIRTEIQFAAGLNWSLFIAPKTFNAWVGRLQMLVKYGYIHSCVSSLLQSCLIAGEEVGVVRRRMSARSAEEGTMTEGVGGLDYHVQPRIENLVNGSTMPANLVSCDTSLSVAHHKCVSHLVPFQGPLPQTGPRKRAVTFVDKRFRPY